MAKSVEIIIFIEWNEGKEDVDVSFSFMLPLAKAQVFILYFLKLIQLSSKWTVLDDILTQTYGLNSLR